MPLTIVLFLCALLVYGIIIFLSVNFLPDINNESLYGIPLLYTLSLGAVALLLAWVKRRRNMFSIYLSLEWVLLILFIGLAFKFLPTFGHYDNVKKNKSSIQASMIANLKKADLVSLNYHAYVTTRIELCKGQMNAAFALHDAQISDRQFNDFGFTNNGATQSVQVKTQINNLTRKLRPDNYEDKKQQDSALIESSKEVVNNWQALGLIRIKSILKDFADKAVYFQQLDMFKLNGEKRTGSYTYSPNYITMNYPHLTTPTILPIIFALLLYVLMLLSWIMAERNFKSPGLFFILKKK